MSVANKQVTGIFICMTYWLIKVGYCESFLCIKEVQSFSRTN